MDTCDMIKSLTSPDTKLCPKPTTQTATVQKNTFWLSLPPFWFEWHFSVYISPPDFWKFFGGFAWHSLPFWEVSVTSDVTVMEYHPEPSIISFISSNRMKFSP